MIGIRNLDSAEVKYLLIKTGQLKFINIRDGSNIIASLSLMTELGHLYLYLYYDKDRVVLATEFNGLYYTPTEDFKVRLSFADTYGGLDDLMNELVPNKSFNSKEQFTAYIVKKNGVLNHVPSLSEIKHTDPHFKLTNLEAKGVLKPIKGLDEKTLCINFQTIYFKVYELLDCGILYKTYDESELQLVFLDKLYGKLYRTSNNFVFKYKDTIPELKVDLCKNIKMFLPRLFMDTNITKEVFIAGSFENWARARSEEEMSKYLRAVTVRGRIRR